MAAPHQAPGHRAEGQWRKRTSRRIEPADYLFGEGDPVVHRMIERHSVSQRDDVPLMGKIEVP